MTGRASFTPEEWRILQCAPLCVEAEVALVDEEQDLREYFALRNELKTAALHPGALVREVLSSLNSEFSTVYTQWSQDPRSCLEGLEEVADLLDRKATLEEARQFKQAMLDLAYKVAEASGGGLLGLGEKESNEESAAIGRVVRALRFE